jgi:pyruvate dehydrogenase E1 component beta subunit
MRGDERVIVLGEDVAEGGPYLVTAGLADEFGRERVRNTPISEGAVCGVAVGAAQSGLRPVVEIMFIDFITLALDQLVNQAAKAHFMSGGQLCVPLVLRTQGGTGQRNGAQHSQNLEAWLTHVPGLKVVMPSGAADAAGLLLSAIADPNPVVFVENKSLYFRREPVPEATEPIPLGRARTVRPGRDVTVVALSRMVGDALEAAERLAREGVEAEVIDPRTLVPLDLETLAQSLRRTGRAVVAHEAVAAGGFGAELAAQLQAAAFDYLEAPIQRVGAPYTPVPVSPALAISRLVSDRRACSRAMLSARAPSRCSIASASHRCWRWATTRISRDSGSCACWRTSALGLANGSERTPSSVRSSSGLSAIFSSRAWNSSFSAT